MDTADRTEHLRVSIMLFQHASRSGLRLCVGAGVGDLRDPAVSDGAVLAIARGRWSCDVVSDQTRHRAQHQRAVALYAALIGVAWCALLTWALSGSLKTQSDRRAEAVAVAPAVVQRGVWPVPFWRMFGNTCCTPDA